MGSGMCFEGGVDGPGGWVAGRRRGKEQCGLSVPLKGRPGVGRKSRGSPFAGRCSRPPSATIKRRVLT